MFLLLKLLLSLNTIKTGVSYKSLNLPRITHCSKSCRLFLYFSKFQVNGFQVPPAELEYILKDHPDVFDAAVVGVPDSSSGERPIAFIVLKEHAKADGEVIVQFVNERVAPYKKIKYVKFLESIPKNPSGKILRKVLKEQYC